MSKWVYYYVLYKFSEALHANKKKTGKQINVMFIAHCLSRFDSRARTRPSCSVRTCFIVRHCVYTYICFSFVSHGLCVCVYTQSNHILSTHHIHIGTHAYPIYSFVVYIWIRLTMVNVFVRNFVFVLCTVQCGYMAFMLRFFFSLSHLLSVTLFSVWCAS